MLLAEPRPPIGGADGGLKVSAASFVSGQHRAPDLVVDRARSTAEIARNIGVHEMTLGKWVKKARESSEALEKPSNVSEREELERLRAENAQLHMGSGITSRRC